MDIVFIVIFLSLIAISIGIIVFTLYSIAKRQDERQDYIKTKAMANTFGVVIGFLIFEIGLDIYSTMTENESNGMNSYLTLFTFCMVYLISLILYSRKHA